MNMLIVSGKLSDVVENPAGETEGILGGATLIERRWVNGASVEIKWHVEIPKFSFGFAKKCAEKDWKVIIFMDDIVSFTDHQWTDAGFMAYGRCMSIQL